MSGSTVLLTGGAGFIGSNLAHILHAHGVRVRVLDNLTTGHRANIRNLEPDLEFIQGDIRDQDACNAAMQGVDYVVHFAAEVSVPRSVELPREAHEINVTGSLNVLMAARDQGVKRVVLASSCAVYGDSPESPKREDMKPEPLSPYASHKLTMEHYAANFSSLYGLHTVALRFFNVFGPHQDPGSVYSAVIPKFAALLLANKAPIIYGDGGQTRDFIFVADVAQAIIRGLTAEEENCGTVYNTGRGEEYSVNDLFGVIAQLLNSDLKPHYEEARAGDVRNSRADISRIENILGFAPRFSFQEALDISLEWYRTHLDKDGKRLDLE